MRLADLLLCSGNTTHLTTYTSTRSTSRLTDTSYIATVEIPTTRLTTWLSSSLNPTFYIGQWIAEFGHVDITGAGQSHSFSFPTTCKFSEITSLKVEFGWGLNSGEYRAYSENILPTGGRVELYHLTQNVAYLDIQISQGINSIDTVWQCETYGIKKGSWCDGLTISVTGVSPTSTIKQVSRNTSFLTTRYSYIAGSRWTSYLTSLLVSKDIEDL